jgi:hypothetical protein
LRRIAARRPPQNAGDSRKMVAVVVTSIFNSIASRIAKARGSPRISRIPRMEFAGAGLRPALGRGSTPEKMSRVPSCVAAHFCPACSLVPRREAPPANTLSESLQIGATLVRRPTK